jgi:hypothetical protein
MLGEGPVREALRGLKALEAKSMCRVSGAFPSSEQ